jgi:hypothetical protein
MTFTLCTRFKIEQDIFRALCCINLYFTLTQSEYMEHCMYVSLCDAEVSYLPNYIMCKAVTK